MAPSAANRTRADRHDNKTPTEHRPTTTNNPTTLENNR